MKLCFDNNCGPEVLDSLTWTEFAPGDTCYPWDTTPTEFLQFAEQDLQEQSKRGAINSICNSKRAIHSHVDYLLHNCGRCLQQSDFPAKLDLLQQLGIIAPGLLSKYNKLRNLIEHEYASPTQAQAEEVRDVATLFIEATRIYTQPLPGSLVFQSADASSSVIVTCHWDERLIRVAVTSGPDTPSQTFRISAYENKDTWRFWIARILRMMRDNSDPYVRCGPPIA